MPRFACEELALAQGRVKITQARMPVHFENPRRQCEVRNVDTTHVARTVWVGLVGGVDNVAVLLVEVLEDRVWLSGPGATCCLIDLLVECNASW